MPLLLDVVAVVLLLAAAAVCMALSGGVRAPVQTRKGSALETGVRPPMWSTSCLFGPR